MAYSSSSKVAILMCTYNGARFVSRQMDSFFQQSHDNWELWVSDDGSGDATLDSIERYQNRGKAITIVQGPRAGASFNFLNLVRRHDIHADYFAWSDQDDIWLPDKLARAVTALERHKDEKPAIYSGRTELVDADERHIAFSPRFRKAPGFANALCQNIGGGNTMVFNRAARRLLGEGDVPRVISHDWWAYLLITGAGGVMTYDPEPTLLYRQHGGNLVGENRSLSAKLHRLRTISSGKYHQWNADNVSALASRRQLLTQANLAIFDAFAAALHADNPLDRLRFLRQAGVYRQSTLQDWVFAIAALCRRYP